MRKWPFFWVPACISFGPFFIAQFAHSEDLGVSIAGSFGAIALAAGLCAFYWALTRQERTIEALEERVRQLE